MQYRKTMISLRGLSELAPAALIEVLQSYPGEKGQLLVLLPERESPQVPMVQDVCRERGIPLAGAIFPEIILDGALCQQGALLLWITDAPPPLLLQQVSTPSSVNIVTQALIDHIGTHLPEDQEASLFCIFDALVPNIATHLDAWYLRLADRVGYFGINAGNERFQPAPCLFDNERCIDEGLLVQLLPRHPGACLEHSYAVPDTFISVTSAESNRVVQIDWQPALAAYRQLMQSQYGMEITRENFYSLAVHFPFGIVRANGDVLVRIPVALAEDDSIICVGEVPPNSVLALLDARSESLGAANKLAAALQPHVQPDDDLLLFYCAGRRLHMGPAAAGEIGEVQARTGARQVLGAISLGEIGSSRSGGYPLFHNATLVGVPCRIR